MGKYTTHCARKVNQRFDPILTPSLENPVDESDHKKQPSSRLLIDDDLTSAENEEKIDISLPTDSHDIANSTIGRSDPSDNKEPVDEHPSTDWEPDREAVLFIKKKIIELGSIEAVNAHYKEDSLICKYARRVAPPIMNKTISKDPFQKTMVCFAVSRKYKGYCVAGKEIIKAPGESSWIRPVSPRQMGELPLEAIQLKDGDKPIFLDIVKIAVKKPLPHFYQAENFLADFERTWEKVGRLKVDELNDYCDDVHRLWVNGYHSANGMNDKIPLEIANAQCESSLVLIQPQDFCLVLSTGLTFKQRIRTEFIFNETTYNLALTDPFVERTYAERTEGRYRIENKQIYLCISIGEPLNGFCYKLVAGVIGLED